MKDTQWRKKEKYERRDDEKTQMNERNTMIKE